MQRNEPKSLIVPYSEKDQMISDSYHGIPCLVYGDDKKAPNGMIIYLHGGPLVQLTNIKERDEHFPSPDPFFNSLVEAGFLVIVPDIRGSNLDNGGPYSQAGTELNRKLYIKDIRDVVTHFQNQYNMPSAKTFGIFHSLGVHQGMYAILQEQMLFSRVILFGGTLYFGARMFSEFASDLVIEKFTKDTPIDSLKKFIDRGIKGSPGLNQQTDLRQGIEDNQVNTILDSAMINPQLNEEMSIGLNIKSLPHSLKIFIGHAIPDSQVPVEFSLECWQALTESQKENIEAHLFSLGDHYFFYNSSSEQQDFFNALISFLKDTNNIPSKIFLDGKETSYSSIQEMLPENSVISHEKFLHSEDVLFKQQNILGIKKYLETYLENIKVVRERMGEIESSVTGRWSMFFQKFKNENVLDKYEAKAKALLDLIMKYDQTADIHKKI